MHKKNIVLIGMTGSGKTTIGKEISQRFNMEFVDMDSIIENQEGTSIKNIFKEQGESYFRDIETECAKKLSERTGIIISTGGGVVKRPENMLFLKKHSVTVFLDRPIENILNDVDMAKRPLLAGGGVVLHEMEKERRGLYLKYSDIVILNDGDAEQCILKLTEELKNFI